MDVIILDTFDEFKRKVLKEEIEAIDPTNLSRLELSELKFDIAKQFKNIKDMENLVDYYVTVGKDTVEAYLIVFNKMSKYLS